MLFLRLGIVLGSLLYGIEVKAMMKEESLVLACHDSHRQMGRDVVERLPSVVHHGHLSILYVLGRIHKHEGCEEHRHEPVENHGKNGGNKEQDYCPSYEFSDV